MNALGLVTISVVVLLAGYFLYGNYISRLFGADPSRPTPAHTMSDGIDYVPARMAVLLGHHFASIAGAAPILGPIAAASFGWLPVLIWILAGAILAGAVHDYGAIIISVRHRGRSIGEVIREHMGPAGHRLFLVFAFSALILIIAVFTIIVSGTFVNTPSTATSSLLFIALAVLFGLAVYKYGLGILPASLVGVPLILVFVFLGLKYPLVIYPHMGGISAETSALMTQAKSSGADLTTPVSAIKAIETLKGEVPRNNFRQELETAGTRARNFWIYSLMAYIFTAAIAPVWILLQPRDYLSSYLLYFMIIGGLAGLFMFSMTTPVPLVLPAFTAFTIPGKGSMFPVLFVTVACGAISGFHSLVASGTTAKQLNNERDARPIGFGGMLIESLLAVLALITVAILSPAQYAESISNPVGLFSRGMGNFMGALGIDSQSASLFVALAVSAFALTSLDTATRLARFCFQELVTPEKIPDPDVETAQAARTDHWLSSPITGTTIAVSLGGTLALSGKWPQIWPIFGAANQLLAGIALLVITLWQYKRGKKFICTLLPMLFMLAVTITSLASSVWTNWAAKPLFAALSAVLLLLAIFLAWEARTAALNVQKKSPL
ncbi:MAG: carbon starvation protein A [Candidatus Wallbacteria bacterium HGW-Wallbacteria-1]|jgi:carbon starvation protein|uniref:Carbon starvation protein A n=1 Tax=Candidatus Wallbacteria bacterium HGW-Wallbacteria-1 TaxID=2013854 RepID=A0A2N1PMB4_9BACT|nr:MAG: carbon starvation protein A [Candidatus Wallbacteria bacterium HGW-Wallbacteria-1]